MSTTMSQTAEHLLFVREVGGPNMGAWVQFFQRFCDGVPGDSWCADVESVIEDIVYGKPQTPRTGNVHAKLEYCRKHNLIVTVPQADDLFFFVDANGHGHHIGIVAAAGTPPQGYAGNTSSDGTSSNGDGFYKHAILPPHGSTVVYARLSAPPA